MMNQKSLIKSILMLLFTLNTVQAELLSSYTLDKTTKIHTIQGSGTISSEIGNTHTIEAIVVGDFQAYRQLKGFFVQEEDTDIDDDPTSSEGLFIVRSHGASVTPATLNLSFDNHNYLERYEGMLVNLPQTLTVSDNYQLGHYGQISLSNGRLMAPTQISSPGSNANAQQAQNDLNRIIIDDGSTSRNPNPIVYPAPKLSATHTLRGGDTVTGITGVLSYRFGKYRVQPTSTPNFISANPRTATPPSVEGSLKVASFNVLNYFNGNKFPTARGAKTADEFQRQRDKIISAIIAMQADIIGLMEIENDGYEANSAIQDLVNGLNAAASAKTYAFIKPKFELGTDKICLSSKVTGATEWHINTDEPQIIDYKKKHYGRYKSAALYNADLYRASDHDPLIIGLNLAKPKNLIKSLIK